MHILLLLVIVLLVLVAAMGANHRRVTIASLPTQRLIRAIRYRPQRPQPANDNTRQSFIYKVEKRWPRTW
jgi:hypothetical protein